MKHKLFSLLMLFCAAPVMAQTAEEGIHFVDAPIATVLQMARQQGKLVFVDCYTSWCGPCKKMTQEVFPQKVVGDYFNKVFVSTKIDMEKGEGPQLGKQWDVNAYPTLLVLNPDGSVKFRTVGSMTPQAFVDDMKNRVENYKDPAFVVSYGEGNRSPEVVQQYIKWLEQNRQTGKLKEVIDGYLSSDPSIMLSDSAAWKLFVYYVSDCKSTPFVYAWKNRDAFKQHYGDKAQVYINDKWHQACKGLYIYGEGNKLDFDFDKAAQLQQYMQEMGVENARERIVQFLLPYCFQTDDRQLFLKTLTESAKMPSIASGQFEYGCKLLSEKAKDDETILGKIEELRAVRKNTDANNVER
ncbi:MAG: thioredoxin family protein [Prevotella sp.]|nr:thioredoxin family protein [Prevotella sp.]